MSDAARDILVSHNAMVCIFGVLVFHSFVIQFLHLAQALQPKIHSPKVKC